MSLDIDFKYLHSCISKNLSKEFYSRGISHSFVWIIRKFYGRNPFSSFSLDGSRFYHDRERSKWSKSFCFWKDSFRVIRKIRSDSKCEFSEFVMKCVTDFYDFFCVKSITWNSNFCHWILTIFYQPSDIFWNCNHRIF